LNLAVSFQLRYRYENHDGLLAASDVNFTSSRYLESTKLSFELRNVALEIK
jgi:hypothetical protein